MNFQDIYKRIYEIDSGKVVEKTATISEECGMPPAMNSPYKPPVTMNVSMNATGPESIRDLIDLISGEAMKEKEMDAAILKLGTQEDAQMEAEIDQALGEGPLDAIKGAASKAADWAFGSEEKVAFEKTIAKFINTKTGDNTAAGRVYAQCKGDDLECLYSYMKQKGLSDPTIDAQAKKFGLKGNANMSVEEYDNEPDVAYKDTAYMTKDISGGLNKQHAQYKKEYPGDNPMAVESTYQQQLKNLYQEIKNR